jgi:mercuric ion transport protein
VNKLNLFSRIADKAGVIGTLGSAFACAACFPAIAGIGAALGFGFLSQWEWTIIETWFPLFAVLVLIANILGFLSHRQWHRSILGMIGPIMVLLSLYPFFKYAWSTYVTYSGIAIMLIISIWDLVSPASKKCEDGECEVAK